MFLCGWFLFANGEASATSMVLISAVVLQMFIAVINEVSLLISCDPCQLR